MNTVRFSFTLSRTGYLHRAFGCDRIKRRLSAWQVAEVAMYISGSLPVEHASSMQWTYLRFVSMYKWMKPPMSLLSSIERDASKQYRTTVAVSKRSASDHESFTNQIILNGTDSTRTWNKFWTLQLYLTLIIAMDK